MSNSIPVVTEPELQKTISKSELPVFVVFSAPWNDASNSMASILENLAIKYSGQVIFIGLNIDDYPSGAAQLDFKILPAYFIFKRGQIVEQSAGLVTSRWLENLIEKIL